MAGANKRSRKTQLWEDVMDVKSTPVTNNNVKAANNTVKPETTNTTVPPQPPEVKQTVSGNKQSENSEFYNPLTLKRVDEKNYGTEGLGGNQQTGSSEEAQVAEVIPEQEIVTPPFDTTTTEPTIQDTDFEEAKDTHHGGGNDDDNRGGDYNNTGGDSHANDDEVTLTPEEEREQTALLAEVLLRNYQKYVPELYKMIGKFSDKKLQKYQDRINFQRIVTHPDGFKTTVLGDIQTFNGAFDALAVSEEWVKDLHPHVEAVLAGQNLKMSHGMYILYKVGEDNVKNITEVMKAGSRLKDYLDFQERETAREREEFTNRMNNTLHTTATPQQPANMPNQQTPPPSPMKDEQKPVDLTPPPPPETPVILETSIETVSAEIIRNEGDIDLALQNS